MSNSLPVNIVPYNSERSLETLKDIPPVQPLLPVHVIIATFSSATVA